MGLAAGQARLLTITGRKSDCEFESMRLSHQKIALARDLADLSNEYQNSLTQTKLVYDYYGTGDTSTPLTYGILMSPSALNNYMPTILTDSMGRVALNSRLAAAARAAGIPQEGLGTLPSVVMRNSFILALGDQGVITPTLANTIIHLPYNQQAGFGGGTTVAATTATGDYSKFVEYLKNNGNSYTLDQSNFPTQERKNAKGKGATSELHIVQIDYGIASGDGHYDNSSDKRNKDKKRDGIQGGTSAYSADTSFDTFYSSGGYTSTFTLGDLLDGSKQYYLGYEGIKGEQSPVFGTALMQDVIFGTFMDWICDELNALNLGDVYTAKALEYAEMMTTDLLYKDDVVADNLNGHDYWRTRDEGKGTDEHTEWGDDPVKKYLDPIGTGLTGRSSYDECYQQWVVTESKNYIGFTYVNSAKGGGDDGNDHATGGINLNNIAQVFLTYFADYMNGVSKTDAYGKEVFEVNIGQISESRLAKQDSGFEYTWKVGSEVSSDDLGQATFYDAMFNQICMNGWTLNKNINDKEYLQQMLQSGMLYISKMKDDGYYYQGNYSIDTYIKEIADETLIAAAEAKYNTEKAKLNAKEETIDLKMKNLDTEISALTTEYDTVKNTISKQIEKSFKRYNA